MVQTDRKMRLFWLCTNKVDLYSNAKHIKMGKEREKNGFDRPDYISPTPPSLPPPSSDVSDEDEEGRSRSLRLLLRLPL